MWGRVFYLRGTNIYNQISQFDTTIFSFVRASILKYNYLWGRVFSIWYHNIMHQIDICIMHLRSTIFSFVRASIPFQISQFWCGRLWWMVRATFTFKPNSLWASLVRATWCYQLKLVRGEFHRGDFHGYFGITREIWVRRWYMIFQMVR